MTQNLKQLDKLKFEPQKDRPVGGLFCQWARFWIHLPFLIMAAPMTHFKKSRLWQMAYSGRMGIAVNRLRRNASGTQQPQTKQLSNRKVTVVWPPERRVN